MSTYNHTAIATGAAAQAATFNSVFSSLDSAIKKNNYAATAAPAVGDDTADGYTVGSRWIDVTNDRSYVAVDVTLGAAVWQLTSLPNTSFFTDSTGRTIFGHTSVFNTGSGINSKLSIFSTATAAGVAGLTAGRFTADANGPRVILFKSRSATIGANAIVQNGDELGRVEFCADDGTDFNTPGASIRAAVDTTPGTGDMPTRIEMSTTADGAATATVALTLKSHKSVILNNAAIATNAIDGFLYIAACAGVPTGVPTAYAGRVPIVIDSTNSKMYIYSGGAWVALN